MRLSATSSAVKSPESKRAGIGGFLLGSVWEAAGQVIEHGFLASVSETVKDKAAETSVGEWFGQHPHLGWYIGLIIWAIAIAYRQGKEHRGPHADLLASPTTNTSGSNSPALTVTGDVRGGVSVDSSVNKRHADRDYIENYHPPAQPTGVPGLKVEYGISQEGRQQLVFKLRSGSPPIKIRKILPLVSEEQYRLEQPLSVLQTEIQEVDQGEPVRCQFMAPHLTHALEMGGPMTLDSLNVEFTVHGSDEVKQSQFFLHKNADGSVVFSTERPHIEPKNLADLRHRLMMLKEAVTALAWAGSAETIATEGADINGFLQAARSRAINSNDSDAKEAFERPLSTVRQDAQGESPWYVTELEKFQTLYSAYRTRVVNSKIATAALLKWAIGEDAPYADVLDAIYQNQMALSNVAVETRRRYTALGESSIGKATVA
jgi:hypothetical protein